MSKTWGGAGAWALEAERAEAEDRERAAEEVLVDEPPAKSLLAGQPDQSYPSLKESVAAKPRKKKGVTVSLSQFQVPTFSVGAGMGRREPSFGSKGLTHEEMIRLPTGPRERSHEELERGHHGGGFGSYGGGVGGGPRGGFHSRDGDGSWGGARRGFGGGFDDDQRRGAPSRDSDFDQPSRADEADNWGAGKKQLATRSMDSGRHDRYSSFGSGSSSRADEENNWWAHKKVMLPVRQPSLRSGDGDSHAPSDGNRWSHRGSIPNEGERLSLSLDSLKTDGEPLRSRSSPFGAARPREEVLTEKRVDWKKMDSEIEVKKSSRPPSSHSSRPSSAQSSRPGTPGSQLAAAAGEVVAKPKPKVNPFGNAKPREVVLQEKGMDWRKLDLELEHRGIDRPETVEEKRLKEEISHLKALADESFEMNVSSAKLSSNEFARIKEDIANREQELELLIQQLDDKIKFGLKATHNSRPGSSAGRSDTFSTRPSSRSGISEESRNIEIIDRPLSHAGQDAWSSSMYERRELHGSRERSFFDNRNMDRPRSRKW